MASDLITRKFPSFNEIRKSTMGLTYQHLNKMIRGKTIKDFDNIQDLVSNSKSLTLFEESLRLIVIDSLKMEKEYVKVLLSQNEFHIKRILKSKWFFQKPVTAEFYMTQIFPQVSLVTRRNIIFKLSKYWNYEKEAEKLTTFICEEYGGIFAEIMLHRCGKEFVKNFVKRTKSPFYYNRSPRSLLYVAKKYPEIGLEMLNFICDSDIYYDIYKFKKVIVYLATYHPHLFISFCEKQHAQLRYLYFGKKLTRHLTYKIKEIIFKNGSMLNSGLLKKKIFFKSLGPEDRIKFVEALVKFNQEKLTYGNWVGVEYVLNDLLEIVHPAKRLPIVETVFTNIYGTDFKAHPDLWTQGTLELFPTKDRLFFVQKMEKLMAEAQEKDNSEMYTFSFDQPETLMYLYDFDYGFEKLKKIMSKAPTVARRENIIIYMVKLCALNKTPERIQKLIEYVTDRHRQDDPTILSEFQEKILQVLHKTSVKPKTLEKLEDVAYLWALKGHSNTYEKISEKLIINRLNEKQDVGKQMKKFFKFTFLDSAYDHVFLYDFESVHCRSLFFSYCDKIVQWIQTNSNSDKKELLIKCIIRTCKEYNKHHPKNKISLLEIPKLKKELRNLLVKVHGSIGGDDWPLEIWDRFYTDIFQFYYKIKFPMYILKKYPEILIKILDKILDNSSNFYFFDGFFLKTKKVLSFYNLLDSTKEKFLTKFKNEEEVRIKKEALWFYSHLTNADEFSEAIADYIPKEEKISDDAEPEFVEIQLGIPGMIKNIRPRWKILNLVLKFFFGDFLRSAVSSYYACCYYTRVDKIVPFLINQFSHLPPRISLKKDVIRIVGDLACRQEKINFFLKCWNNNTHYSIRMVLFSYTTKSFMDHPTKTEFDAMKKFILEGDEMVIGLRPDLNRIPNEYLNDYVMALWNFSEKQPAKFKNTFRSAVVINFNRNNIPFLAKDFCEKLIKENLFTDTLLNVTNFSILYLISDPNEVKKRTVMILELLKSSLSRTNSIADFLKYFLNMAIKDVRIFSTIIDAFLQSWPESLNVKLYSDRLMFQYYQLFCNVLKNHSNVEVNKNEIATQFGKQLKAFYLGLNMLNDLIVLLIDTLSKLLKNLVENDLKFDAIYILNDFFADPFNRTLVIMALSVLPDDIVYLYFTKETIFDEEEKNRKQMITEIVENLRTINDEVINFYLYKKFKNLELNKK